MRLIDSHGLFQGQNELAKEQQACTLAIGDVMVMSVQIDETGNTTPKTNTHTHTQVTNSISIWMLLDHVKHYSHFGLSKSILVSTPRGPLPVDQRKGSGSGSTSFSASRSVGQSGRTFGFRWPMVMWKKPNGDVMCEAKAR